jgi:hypothetical protein
MSSKVSKEGQVIRALTPKCVLEASSQEVGVGGIEAASLKMTNASGERFTCKHLETGQSRVESEGRLEIVVGEKLEEGQGLTVHTPHGDIDFKVEDGFFKVKATNICFEAEDSIVMKAAKMQIGDEKQTSQIVIAAQKVEAKAKKGNLAAAIKTDSVLASFAGSFVTDKVEDIISGAAGSAGGGSC